MGHYDGKEFEKILQEAQANMMKGIPSLDIEENSGLPPAATAEQAGISNRVESLSGMYLAQIQFKDNTCSKYQFNTFHSHFFNSYVNSDM